MVVWSKILPIAALGVGVLFLVNAFQRPAAATSTAEALTAQVSTLGAAGTGIQQFGQGIGGGIAGLFQPLWEISNIIERFSTLVSGAANVSPVSQDLGGYAGSPTSPTYTSSSGPLAVRQQVAPQRQAAHTRVKAIQAADMSGPSESLAI